MTGHAVSPELGLNLFTSAGAHCFRAQLTRKRTTPNSDNEGDPTPPIYNHAHTRTADTPMYPALGQRGRQWPSAVPSHNHHTRLTSSWPTPSVPRPSPISALLRWLWLGCGCGLHATLHCMPVVSGPPPLRHGSRQPLEVTYRAPSPVPSSHQYICTSSGPRPRGQSLLRGGDRRAWVRHIEHARLGEAL